MFTDKKNIRSLNLQEIKDFCVSERLPPFRGKQIYEWLWKKSVKSFEEMSNLSEKHRRLLNDRFVINHAVISEEQKSEDKIRIRISNGESKHVFDYGYTLTQTNQINALNIIYNNWGIGLISHKFKGFIIDQYEDFHNDINELGIPTEDLEINIYE